MIIMFEGNRQPTVGSCTVPDVYSIVTRNKVKYGDEGIFDFFPQCFVKVFLIVY